MLLSVLEHSMTPLNFETAQKNSASLRSSRLQFENSNGVILCSITEQSTPSYVLATKTKRLTLSCPGGDGCSAPPLRFFAHNSEREKDNSTKFGDFPENI